MLVMLEERENLSLGLYIIKLNVRRRFKDFGYLQWKTKLLRMALEILKTGKTLKTYIDQQVQEPPPIG